ALLQAKVGGSDVVQETILEALACFARFRGQTLAELQGWLRTILLRQVSRATHRFRDTDKRQVDLEIPLAEMGGEGAALAAEQSAPAGQVSRQDQAARVREVLERLPEHYRVVLVWREWEELPFGEIARRLGRSVDAARMLFWRAVERFHEEMRRPR